MYQRILVATDGSPLSDKAVKHAIALARAVGAKLVAFHASADYENLGLSEGSSVIARSRKAQEAAAERDAQKLLASVVRKATTAGVGCTPMHAMAAAPWEAILDAARKTRADAIVMASHGRGGLSALLLGSETQKVLTHSKLPVTVIR